MRFLFLTQYFPPEIGAAQVRLGSVARELVELGHGVEVVTAMPNHPAGRIFPGYGGRFYCRESWAGIPVHRVWLYPSLGAGWKRMLNYLSFTATCPAGLVRAGKPDYLFVESPPLFLGAVGAAYSSLRGVPLIFNVSDLWPDSVRAMGLMREGTALRLAGALERWIYRRSAYINGLTEGIGEVLVREKNVPVQKVLFLPNGVDTKFFKPLPYDAELARELGLAGKKTIVYAGTMGYAHGLEVSLMAMDLVRETTPDVVLLFIGGGSEKERLMRLAGELGLRNVLFMDPRPPEFIARLYSIAYAGLASARNLPLFKGARSSKMFPVMACGKPVVYRGDGEGPRLVEEARAGLVARSEEPGELAAAICKLVQNPDLANELGQNGRNYVENNFSWRVLVRNWLAQLAAGGYAHGRERG